LKHREEIECRIESAETTIRILQEVGFKSAHRVFEIPDGVRKRGLQNVSLDETEAGNYLEVEGPSDEEITELGTKLGYSEQDFVRRTYARLIRDKRGVG
jgi:predicted adenylyl cyclase CyaB